jgi:hypothetical protein
METSDLLYIIYKRCRYYKAFFIIDRGEKLDRLIVPGNFFSLDNLTYAIKVRTYYSGRLYTCSETGIKKLQGTNTLSYFTLTLQTKEKVHQSGAPYSVMSWPCTKTRLG